METSRLSLCSRSAVLNMPPSKELVTYKVNGIFAVIFILSHDSYTALGIVVKAIYFPPSTACTTSGRIKAMKKRSYVLPGQVIC